MDLKDQFSDAAKVPIGETLSSSQTGFLGVFNEVFGFHDSELWSYDLSVDNRTLEMVFDYIVRWDLEESGVYNRKWRKLKLDLGDILFIEFGDSSEEFGLRHYVRRRVDLRLRLHDQPDAVRRLSKTFPTKLQGAVLDNITVRKFHDSFLVEFEWLTTKTPTMAIDNVCCTDIKLSFTADPRPER